MTLYMFRRVLLSIIRSLFTVHSAMVYVIQVCRQLSSRTRSCSKAVYKPVWRVPLLSVQWINSWWLTDELSETCRVSWQNKFVKLVHLVGFITKKYVCGLNPRWNSIPLSKYKCRSVATNTAAVLWNLECTPPVAYRIHVYVFQFVVCCFVCTTGVDGHLLQHAQTYTIA